MYVGLIDHLLGGVVLRDLQIGVRLIVEGVQLFACSVWTTLNTVTLAPMPRPAMRMVNAAKRASRRRTRIVYRRS